MATLSTIYKIGEEIAGLADAVQKAADATRDLNRITADVHRHIRAVAPGLVRRKKKGARSKRARHQR